MKILLSAFIGSHNLGDEAIARVLINKLESHAEIDLTVLTINVSKTKKLTSENTTQIKKVGIINFIREIHRCDCLALGGGGIIQDESSVINIIYYYVQVATARILFRKKVTLLFVGVTPMKTKLGNRLLRSMSRLIEHSLVRDQESAQQLVSHGFKSHNITTAYDLVFNFPIKPKVGKSGYPSPYILFCPRDWFFTKKIVPTKYALRQARKNPHSRLHEYRGSLLRLTEQTLRDNPDLIMVGVPFFFTQDLNLLEWIHDQLANKYKNRFIIEYTELLPEQFLQVAQESAIVLGVRLHSLILGAIARKPLVPLVYSSKVKNLVNYIHAGAFTTFLEEPAFLAGKTAIHIQQAMAQDTKTVEKQYSKILTHIKHRNEEALHETLKLLLAA